MSEPVQWIDSNTYVCYARVERTQGGGYRVIPSRFNVEGVGASLSEALEDLRPRYAALLADHLDYHDTLPARHDGNFPHVFLVTLPPIAGTPSLERLQALQNRFPAPKDWD